MLSSAEAVYLAGSLRRIRDDALAPGAGGGKRVWYQGQEPDFDLFVEIDSSGTPHWVQMTHRGRFVSCDFGRSHFATGDTQYGAPGNVRHIHSQPLRSDATPDLELLDDAIHIVSQRADPLFADLARRLNSLRSLLPP